MNQPFKNWEAIRSSIRSRTLGRDSDMRNGPTHQWIMQRLIARLAYSVALNWAVKGAQALVIRLPDVPRTTRDIDAVFHAASCDEAVAEFTKAITRDTPDQDFLDFHVLQARQSRVTQGLVHLKIGVAIRAMKPRPFPPFSVDLLVSDHVITDADTVHLHPSIDVGRFTDWPTVPVVSTAQHIAEKLAAMYTLHNGLPSTRERDFTDLVLLCRNYPPQRAALVYYLHATAQKPLSEHAMLEFPSVFTPSETGIAFYKTMRALPPVAEAIQIVEAVVNPALAVYHAECASGNAPVCGEGATHPHAPSPTPTDESAGKREHEEQADAENVVRGRERFWHTLHTAHPRPFPTHGGRE